MANKESKSTGTWSIVKIIGALIAVIGLAALVYSVFTLTSSPQGFTHGAYGFNRTAIPNGTTFNGTGTSRFGRASVGFFGGGAYGIVIGILALLLGIVTYKYAQLKTAFLMKK